MLAALELVQVLPQVLIAGRRHLVEPQVDAAHVGRECEQGDQLGDDGEVGLEREERSPGVQLTLVDPEHTRERGAGRSGEVGTFSDDAGRHGEERLPLSVAPSGQSIRMVSERGLEQTEQGPREPLGQRGLRAEVAEQVLRCERAGGLRRDDALQQLLGRALVDRYRLVDDPASGPVPGEDHEAAVTGDTHEPLDLPPLPCGKTIHVGPELVHRVLVGRMPLVGSKGSRRLPLHDQPVEDGVSTAGRQRQLGPLVQLDAVLADELVERALGLEAKSGFVTRESACGAREHGDETSGLGCEEGARLRQAAARGCTSPRHQR